MALCTATVKLRGIAPLMFSNIESANPTNPLCTQIREITDRPATQRSDADMKRLMDLQWRVSVYTDADGDVCIPAANIDRMLIDAAAKVKKGLGGALKAGVFTSGDAKVQHEAKTTDKAATDPRFRLAKLMSVSKTNKAKVMRCRPMFPSWKATVTVSFDSDLVAEEMLKRIFECAGQRVGTGDSRPRCGRFEVESFSNAE